MFIYYLFDCVWYVEPYLYYIIFNKILFQFFIIELFCINILNIICSPRIKIIVANLYFTKTYEENKKINSIQFNKVFYLYKYNQLELLNVLDIVCGNYLFKIYF